MRERNSNHMLYVWVKLLLRSGRLTKPGSRKELNGTDVEWLTVWYPVSFFSVNWLSWCLQWTRGKGDLRRSELVSDPFLLEASRSICKVSERTHSGWIKAAPSSGGGSASWTHRWWRPRPGRGCSGCSWEKDLGTIPSWCQTLCTHTSASFSEMSISQSQEARFLAAFFS